MLDREVSLTEDGEQTNSKENDSVQKARSKHFFLPQKVLNFCADHIGLQIRHLSFITAHYVYFITTCLFSSLILWGSSTRTDVRYIDAIFLTTSAMTEAGLNTINLSELNSWQQVMLFLLIIMGSAIFVSYGVILVRKRAFEKKLEDLAEHHQRRLLYPRSFSIMRSRSKQRMNNDADPGVPTSTSSVLRGRPIRDPPEDAPYQPSRTIIKRHKSSFEKIEGLAKHTVSEEIPQDTRTDSKDITEKSEEPGQIMKQSQEKCLLVPFEIGAPQTQIATGNDSAGATLPSPSHIQFSEEAKASPKDLLADIRARKKRSFTNIGVGAHSIRAHPRFSRPLSYEIEFPERSPSDQRNRNRITKSRHLEKYLETKQGYIGRNSQVLRLSGEERRKLGGIEYDAICILAWVVPLYFVLFQLFSALACGAWMQANRPNTSQQNGLNPFWTGCFFAISAFNNNGMALLDANAVALQTSYFMLLTLALLILAGNTCFPPFLRLILWTLKEGALRECTSERLRVWRKTLEFILDHPRRVYTNLFPSGATWWLVFTLVILNGIDWVAFEILNLGNRTLDSIPARFRALDGLFQAFAVRSGGFYVVPISALYPGTLVLYVLMMYLSAFPISITVRNTNIYEERSLAIFAQDEESSSPEQDKPSASQTALRLVRSITKSRGDQDENSTSNATWKRSDFIRQQLRGQLGHDLWWLGLAILFITIIETSSIHSDPINFSVFNIIFEVVSAYGTVGISVGIPWNSYSFCGAWHTASKLILITVMLRGRHRGLPVAIDRAILLPDSSLAWAEEEDGRMRRRGRPRGDDVV